MNKVITILVYVIGFSLFIFFAYLIMLFAAFGSFDEDYSVTELKEHVEANQSEIYELKRYFNEIVPKNRLIEIEFEDDHTLAILGIKALDSTAGDPYAPMFIGRDLILDNTFIKQIGWTAETLKVLKEKLDKAECISIESGEPTKIGFQRSGLGMYFFNVFEKPMPDYLQVQYNDSCTYILANDQLVLEYGGGAVGPQCFYLLD